MKRKYFYSPMAMMACRGAKGKNAKEALNAIAKKIVSAVFIIMTVMAFFTAFAEECDFSFPPGVLGDVLTQMRVTPDVVESPQTVDVCIAIKNSTGEQKEVALYSPAGQQIGEPYQLDPDQTILVNCRYEVNQRTIDNGTLVYYVKYSISDEYGKEIDRIQPVRYKLNSNARPWPSSTPVPTEKPASEWPTLTATEVRYNYANSYQKDFYLKGVGELRNYYNYAYDKCEKDYFCMRVITDGPSYDSWYIYFHRESFRDLFSDAVRNGKVTLEMKCNVTRYAEGQHDIAEALMVRWWK